MNLDWVGPCRLGTPASSKSKPGSKQTQAEAAGMRERDELLREAEEETDVEVREGFNQGEDLLVSIPTDILPPTGCGHPVVMDSLDVCLLERTCLCLGTTVKPRAACTSSRVSLNVGTGRQQICPSYAGCNQVSLSAISWVSW